MDTINYKNYLTNKKEKYILRENEKLTEGFCPIDGTQIIYRSMKLWEGYVCPNCDTKYENISKEGLIKTKKIFLEQSKEKINRLTKKINDLSNLITKLKE
jgi:hypothetical protein